MSVHEREADGGGMCQEEKAEWRGERGRRKKAREQKREDGEEERKMGHKTKQEEWNAEACKEELGAEKATERDNINIRVQLALGGLSPHKLEEKAHGVLLEIAP